MKYLVPASLALLLCAIARADAPQPLPTPFPESRYQQMSAKSPFSVASESAATAAPTPGFASQLYISGVAVVGNSQFVAIKSRDDDPQHPPLFLQVGQSSPDGMKVESVKWADEMGKSTVDVSKNGEKATLIFDEAQMAKGDAGQPGPGGIRLPTLPGRPANFPMQPTGPFNRNRIFPQAPGQPGAIQGVNPGALNGVDVRRRVHIIQSGQ